MSAPYTPSSYPYWPGSYNSPVTGTQIPIGTIIQYPISTAPSGYLNCDGSAINRNTYSGLFNLIGTTYGVGNGGAETVSTWVVVVNLLYINFAGNTNTNIIAGNSFTFNNGTNYPNLIALTASTSQITATVSFTGTGVGGTVQLTTPTTFNLPNTVGVTIRGSGTSWTIGSTGGFDTTSLLPANLPSHKHDITIVANGSGSASGGITTSAPPGSGTNYTTGIVYDNSNAVATSAGSNGASFGLINKYLVLNYCIKY